MTDSEKHTSLLICEAKKSVKVPTPRVSISKHFSLSLTKGSNKLHRLSLASPSSLVEYLRVRPEAYPRGEHLVNVKPRPERLTKDKCTSLFGTFVNEKKNIL